MNNRVQNILMYTGLAGAIAGGIGYILIIMALVMGFETELSQNQQLLIAIIGAADGMLINVALRFQGIALAEQEESSKQVNERYQKLINKDKPIKKYRLIGYYMGWAIFRDFITKGATVALSSYFLLYIFMEGNGDYSLFLLALANLVMFAGFGAMGMAGMYKKYIQNHIPALQGICDQLDQSGSVRLEEKEHGLLQQHEIQHTSETSTSEQGRHIIEQE